MPSGEVETIFSSKIKYSGVFLFKNFYQFCYEWLAQELGFNLLEDEYSEKITGDSKNIDVKWTGTKAATDYFRFKVAVKFKITNLTNIEVVQDNMKLKTNKGDVSVTIKGDLERDYQGQYDETAFRKFMRSIYEKWVIQSRIKEYEDKLVNQCDDFLSQSKAYLDLEGRKS